MNEKDLKSFFSTVGKVSTVKVVVNLLDGKSRGYGFVEMSNGFEADQAVAKLNGQEILGRFVRVDRAKSCQQTFLRRNIMMNKNIHNEKPDLKKAILKNETIAPQFING
jgi:RNA recognition motif-containing protein